MWPLTNCLWRALSARFKNDEWMLCLWSCVKLVVHLSRHLSAQGGFTNFPRISLLPSDTYGNPEFTLTFFKFRFQVSGLRILFRGFFPFGVSSGVAGSLFCTSWASGIARKLFSSSRGLSASSSLPKDSLSEKDESSEGTKVLSLTELSE